MQQAVTIGLLTYRDPSWLSWVLANLIWAKNETPYRVLVVGNDAEPDVVATGRLDVIWRNMDSSLTRMGRIYTAWNVAVQTAGTELVCLVNDDMAFADYWLDRLVEAYSNSRKTVPTSTLVESGWIPSAVPEYVRDLGLTPDTFDVAGFAAYAASISKPVRRPGRLYMPCLLERSTFLRVGGYPAGNPPGTTGDKALFARLAEEGYMHTEVGDSICYHVQAGSSGGYYPDA